MPHPHAADDGRTLFHDAPRRVYWELTRACSLACQHCRAKAEPRPESDELSKDEVMSVMRSLRAPEKPPMVVLTGGDPLERPDFWELLDYAISIGLPISVAPSVTPRLDVSAIGKLAERGVRAMSISLDAASAQKHDGIRGVPGCYDRSLEAAAAVVEAGIPLQFNTLVTRDTVGDLPVIAELAEKIGVRRWSPFFLVSTGRGRGLPQISPEQCDETLRWLEELSQSSSFIVGPTEAPHYRRIQLERRRARGERERAVAGAGIRDGNGILFLSCRGEVMPSGFLPLSVGNVRMTDALELYREAPLFVALRHAELFRGRCGRCELREVCGGSRARAYAANGDPFGEDPLCLYEGQRR